MFRNIYSHYFSFSQFLTERKQKIGVDELFGQWKIQVVDHSKQYDGNSCGVYTLTVSY
jgi:hypothetical protein